jgi:hypothetical protein
MQPGDILTIVIVGVLGAVAFSAVIAAGVFFNTRQKIRHGYPLENAWGKPLHPQITNEAQERVKLLTQENAQLRAELGSLHDRLVSVERIVTDSGYGIGHEIEQLREGKKGKMQ